MGSSRPHDRRLPDVPGYGHDVAAIGRAGTTRSLDRGRTAERFVDHCTYVCYPVRGALLGRPEQRYALRVQRAVDSQHEEDFADCKDSADRVTKVQGVAHIAELPRGVM